MNKVKYKLLEGDCIERMKELPDNYVQCVITSPPYYGLRDYGVKEQIGLEESHDHYVQKMVEVFREVKRILHPSGTLWLNLGDSYTGSNMKSGSAKKSTLIGTHTENIPGAIFDFDKKTPGLKRKNLIGIPWRVAFALQNDGWYLRQDIIWHKQNPMPESIRDRCTKAHEYIFLLSKNEKYYYDAEAIKENVESKPDRRLRASTFRKSQRIGQSLSTADYIETVGRNKRSVWTVTTFPFKEVHFAVYPVKLIEPCVLAGTKEFDIIFDPFTGSGTTGVAAMKNRRNFIGTELNPEYVEIARKRLSKAKRKANLLRLF